MINSSLLEHLVGADVFSQCILTLRVPVHINTDHMFEKIVDTHPL